MRKWIIGCFSMVGLTFALLLGPGALPALSFNIVQAPEMIFIEAPLAGATLTAGSQYEIMWDIYNNTYDDFNLSYSTDGTNFTLIASGDKDTFGPDDSYTWTVPDISASSVVIRLGIVVTPQNVPQLPPDIYYNDSGQFSINQSISIAKPNLSDIKPMSPIPAAETSATPSTTTDTLVYTIGESKFQWNGINQTMDVAPMVREDRTLLPIRYVADPLGAQVFWNELEQKVTIKNNDRTIELWINNNTAAVDGKEVLIDPNNSKVMPIIIPPGRTMLPLRFIADNLDCNVEWKQETQEAIVTYPK